MNEITCLDHRFSTTRRVRKVAPEVVFSEIKAEKKPDDQVETILFLSEAEGRIGQGGLRTKACFKKSEAHRPLITVVTVVLNDEVHLEGTILSVINQAYENIEYIVIDGASTDGTVDIIRKYENAIDYWVSEPDSGIYDAMNKSLILSSKDAYLIWINAGDLLNDLSFFERDYDPDIDVFFFSVIQETPEKKWIIEKTKKVDEKNIFFPRVHHQGLVVAKRAINTKYDTDFALLSDLLFMSNLINCENIKKQYVTGVFVATYKLGGVSDRKYFARCLEYLKLIKLMKLNLFLSFLYNYKEIFKLTLKAVVPYAAIKFIRKVI